MGARRNFSRGVQTQRLVKVGRYICLVSTCGTPTPAVVFHCVEKRLMVSLCQTLCVDSVLQKPENQNPGACKCTTLHLRAGALVSNIHQRLKYLICCNLSPTNSANFTLYPPPY